MRLKKYFEWSRERSSIISKKNISFWIFGFFAFLWVLIRSGTNPKRLTYPCQQVALPFASSWFIAALGIFGGIVVLKRLMRYSLVVSIVILLGILSISSVKQTQRSIESELPTWQVENPLSRVAVIDNIPLSQGSLSTGDASVPDSYLSDPAMNSLATLLEELGTPLYKTSSSSDGLIGADDIVVIKGNFQWDFRLGTNTDRIKGLIWLLLNHPDNFTGEILVCDNTQFSDIGQSKNNSEDTEQSIVDVVTTFNAKGYPVYIEDWTDYSSINVAEYTAGDYTNGYIYDDKSKISYPKFQTPSGEYLSLRHGIWSSEDSSYDPSKLSIINFPVLKAHSWTGATVAIKNWIGVLTTADYNDRFGGSTSMHYDYFWSEYALVARVMELTYPKLNIIDATWTSAQSNNKYFSEYTYNTGKLIASTDPIAASWYAAKYILYPLAVKPQNVNPDDPNSIYGSIIRRWYNYLSDSAGIQCTLDSSKISVYNSNDINESSYLFVSPNSDTVSSKSGTTNFSVSSNVEWSVNDDNVSWLSATKTDENTISVSYSTNTSTDPRTAHIKADGAGGLSEIITITQSGAEAFIEVSPDNQTVSSESDSITFTINSNTYWEVSESSDWLSTNKFSDLLLVVNYDENTSKEDRSAIISFTVEGLVLQTINIVQKGTTQTSFVELVQDKRITLYPNPTKDFLIIEAFDLGEYIIAISSQNGQVLAQETVEKSQHIIDLSNFREGVYFLTIRSKSFVTTRKIIKQ